MDKNNIKTNVMRILDQKKIKYNSYFYDAQEAVSGDVVAKMINKDLNQVFKTLVTVSGNNKYYVFVVPVNKELNLKKAAIAVNEKSIQMIKSKDLLPLTGYVHGGCSPIGMKKFFRTTIHNSAKEQESIIFSAGKIGYQVELVLSELSKVIKFDLNDIVD